MFKFKGMQYEREIILLCVRWYLTYPLSYRNLEEMMKERGLPLVHSTIYRWLIAYSPQFIKKFKPYKKNVDSSWRLDETYIKIKGEWKYLYRAVDKSMEKRLIFF